MASKWVMLLWLIQWLLMLTDVYNKIHMVLQQKISREKLGITKAEQDEFAAASQK